MVLSLAVSSGPGSCKKHLLFFVKLCQHTLVLRIPWSSTTRKGTVDCDVQRDKAAQHLIEVLKH